MGTPTVSETKIVALGANLSSPFGAPRETLARALRLLDEAGVTIEQCSRWYSTPAWPPGAGPSYTNAAARVVFKGGARELLHILQNVENALGRVRSQNPSLRWGARVCDLDFICSGALVSPGLVEWREASALTPEDPLPELALPHPRAHKRVFVLAPMAEIAPRWSHPVLGMTVTEMLEALPEAERAEAIPMEA